jgi:hypothetical protein
MEMGSTFISKMPKYPIDDPDYRIIRRVPSRYLHYYFYIRDPVIGPRPEKHGYPSKVETAYCKADRAIQQVLDLFAA